MGDLQKAGTIIELALIGGIMFLGYKIYKDIFPDKTKPPGGNTPLGTVGDLIKTVNDTANTPVPSTGSPGQDFLRSVIVPKPLMQVAVKVQDAADNTFGGITGYKELRGLNDWIVKSPLVQWNPAFPQFWGNAIDFVTGAGKNLVPVAKAQQLSINDKVATQQINLVKSQGFSSILIPQVKPAFVPSASNLGGKAVEAPMRSQSMGGTGSEILDTPGILDYINIGKAPNSQLEKQYQSIEGKVQQPSAYRNPVTGAISSSPQPGFDPVYSTLIPTKEEPPKPITVPAAPANIVNYSSPVLPSYELLPAGMISVNWQSGANSRYRMDGIGWIVMSEADARARGMIK